MQAFLQEVGKFFLEAAVVVFLIFWFLRSRDREAVGVEGAMETALVLVFTAIPGILAWLAFYAAGQVA